MNADCSMGTATSICQVVGVGVGATPAPTSSSSGRASLPDAVAILTCTPNDDVCGSGRTSASLTCNDTWQNYANGFFATTCIGSCHRHDQSFATVDLVRGRADAVRQKVESGAMPLDSTLSEAERLRLLTWLACGAP